MRVAFDTLRALRAYAASRWPDECCGWMILEDNEVREWWPAANVSQTPEWHYVMEPSDLLDMALAVAAGQDVIVFHSHPRSRPWPSVIDVTDARNANYPVRHLILGTADGEEVREGRAIPALWNLLAEPISGESVEVAMPVPRTHAEGAPTGSVPTG